MTVGIELTLLSGAKATLSYQHGLIMLHSPDISAQWFPNRVGIQLMGSSEAECQLGFHTNSQSDIAVCQNYQSFFFKGSKFKEVSQFILNLGFPPNCILEINPDLMMNKPQAPSGPHLTLV